MSTSTTDRLERYLRSFVDRGFVAEAKMFGLTREYETDDQGRYSITLTGDKETFDRLLSDVTSPRPNLRYTLVFVYDEYGRVLMLKRNNPPNAGLWNGLGGKIEPGETPREGAIREVHEESGIHVADARFGGIVTWPEGDGFGGMYVYTAPLPKPYGELRQHLVRTDEGVLAWFRALPDGIIGRLVGGQYGLIVDNIEYFLPPMLDDAHDPSEYRCHYDENGVLSDVTVLPLDQAIVKEAS